MIWDQTAGRRRRRGEGTDTVAYRIAAECLRIGLEKNTRGVNLRCCTPEAAPPELGAFFEANQPDDAAAASGRASRGGHTVGVFYVTGEREQRPVGICPPRSCCRSSTPY